jgi:hypothetical protein
MKRIHTCIAALSLLCAGMAHAQTPTEVILDGRKYLLTLTPLDPGIGPKPPTGLAVSRQAASIDLAWTDASDNETGFAVWRRMGTGDWTKEALLAANTSRFTDWTAGVTGSVTYRVQSVGAEGSSPFSNEVTVTLGGTVRLPGAEVIIHSVRPPIALPVDLARNAKLLVGWEVNGANFGEKPGRILVNGLVVPHLWWSDSRVMIAEPPAECSITVQSADGAYYTGMHRREVAR